MTHPLTSTRIEFHILQSFPVTCLNRDDVGAPKTAVIGGSTRARVSSQCWKRQVRMALPSFGIKLGYRTKQTTEMFSKACLEEGATVEQANSCSEKMSNLLVEKTLLFISDTEAKAFAQYAKSLGFEVFSQPPTSKSAIKTQTKNLAKVAKDNLNPAIDSLDIALFGRMVARATDMNVEAASSFSHAISTHKVTNDVDFFTALDDCKTNDDEEESSLMGSSHMGTNEFNSATYYRYVSLDVGELAKVLDGENLDKAIEAFTKALFVAVPSARQATQSGASPWEFARVLVRKGQRLQVPFETAVKAKDGGFLQPSIDEMTSYLDKKEKLAGSLFGKVASFDWGVNENFSIDELITALTNVIK
ncbi:type I-E CRISPR-associated protein Cas7/Cse4/CasC (plasmid) [Pseudomonas silesiensis]|uniref:type I-E CRISPR-associated protein Cas7/Cse4/CasC n=1 Tax=Pseudomonas silesiensis TaxID=1853130 RepID=UPI0030D0D2A2